MKPMRLTFLLLLAAPYLLGQSVTTVTGTLLDGSGNPANCEILAKPLRVAGFSPTVVPYAMVAGDTTGTTSGYGASASKIIRHQPLALLFGTYATTIACSGAFGSKVYVWKIPPGGSIDISVLNQKNGLGRTFGETTTTFTATPKAFGDQ